MKTDEHGYIDAQEGDIAVVTQKSGNKYVGVWTLARGIDYFWCPVVPGTGGNQLVDPDVSFEIVGHMIQGIESWDD